MSFNFLDQAYVPEDSYSRQLDRQVASDEYPYGYVVETASGCYDESLHPQHFHREAYEISSRRKP